MNEMVSMGIAFIITIMVMIMTLVLPSAPDDVPCDNFPDFYDWWINNNCPGGCPNNIWFESKNGCCMNVSRFVYGDMCEK